MERGGLAHFGLSFRGWGTPLALFILAAMGVGGSFVHIVLHADGPLLPRPGLIEPMLIEFFYLVIVFMVAAFVGVMARRDDRPGYGEIADATPAPLGSRVAGRALAAAAVTVVFALTPVLAVWVVTLLAVPDAFSLSDPFLYFGLRLAPALLELCALVLLAHALIRHAGAAHAAGVICAFFIVVNHELGVTSYPPAEIGVPPSITLSEFSGWAPWLDYVLTADLFKLAVAAAILALAWLAWPRGTALTAPLRWRTGMRRCAGGAGALAAAAVAVAIGTHRQLHDQLVTVGGYESAAAATADDVATMRACVAATLGSAPAVGTVLQAPRERGETALYGDLLWLPEHEGWDIAGEALGRWRRRATIAAALAARAMTDGADLRKEPGEDWLRVGVPGWVGLECVRQEDGVDAWLALQARASDRVVEAFGALDSPAVGVAAAGDVPWVREYTPLATVGWVESIDLADAADAVHAVVARVRGGASLADALAEVAGGGTAEALLGPPASSDVLVTQADRMLDIGGQRWLWRDGGWGPVAGTILVTQRFDDSGDRRRIGPVPTTVDPEAPFTLIDAWPSFERTPSDNVWRGGGDN